MTPIANDAHHAAAAMPLFAGQLWGDIIAANARRFGEKIAFIEASGRNMSFLAFDQRVNRLCNALGQLGLRHASRIAILSRNRIEVLEVYGATKGGFVVVPLNWRLSPAELRYQFEHARPDAVIVDAEGAARIAKLKSDGVAFGHVLVLQGDAPAADAAGLSYEALLQTASDGPPAYRGSGEDILCLMYTSGTTGLPKAVKLTQLGLMTNCAAFVTALSLESTDVALAALPLFHVGGMWYHLAPNFAAGATTLLMADFDPGRVAQAIADHQVTNVHLVPTMISALLGVAGLAELKLNSLRTIFYAASAIPIDLLRRAMAMFGGDIFVQSYGSTECGAITLMSPEDHLKASQPGHEGLLASCGRPLAGVAVRILNELSEDCELGEIGEIFVRSAGTMAGYWEPSDRAQPLARGDGWLGTGDLGRFDGAGYLYIVDRKHDMIVTGGENVYPREVEDALFGDSDIEEVAVFALPDPVWVEKVAAAVRLRPGAEPDADRILQRARQRLAGYKCPKTIFFVESLPKSGSGKILKTELRKIFAENKQMAGAD